MERTAKAMRARHAREIAVLQKQCKHPTPEWMPYEWAPGHLAADVLVCRKCEKMLNEKKRNPTKYTTASGGAIITLRQK